MFHKFFGKNGAVELIGLCRVGSDGDRISKKNHMFDIAEVLGMGSGSGLIDGVGIDIDVGIAKSCDDVGKAFGIGGKGLFFGIGWRRGRIIRFFGATGKE